MTRLSPELRSSVRTLHAQGKGLREISRLLGLSRNTVRGIVRTCDEASAPELPLDDDTLARLTEAFSRARGNVVRAQELLSADGMTVPYSTLTRWVRVAGLRAPPKRAGSYEFAPGEEMQHDTSPHRLELAGKTVTAACAGLVLAWSRRLFIQYHPRFSRFEAKAFLLDAIQFMDGSCQRCVIDNSSVILAGGSGADARIAPEMEAFARTLGFRFQAHEVGHPDRKGRIERPFSYVERNFLAGRTFEDYTDLNRQAVAWCREVANAKPKKVLGQSPEAAYLIEKPHLTPVPEALPPVYEVLKRTVDASGFVSVDTNRYSVPERLVDEEVAVYKHGAEIHVYRKRKVIAVLPRLIGQRDGKSLLPGHHTIPNSRRRRPAPEEIWLQGHHPALDRYAAALKQRSNGWGRRGLRRLLALKRTYPHEPFIAAVKVALRYGLFDLGRLEALILKQVAGCFFALGDADNDAALDGGDDA